MANELAKESCSSDFTLLLSEDVLELMLEHNKTLLPLLCLPVLTQAREEQWNSGFKSGDVRRHVILMLWEVLDTCNAS